jgi:hypothetical protein
MGEGISATPWSRVGLRWVSSLHRVSDGPDGVPSLSAPSAISAVGIAPLKSTRWSGASANGASPYRDIQPLGGCHASLGRWPRLAWQRALGARDNPNRSHSKTGLAISRVATSRVFPRWDLRPYSSRFHRKCIHPVTRGCWHAASLAVQNRGRVSGWTRKKSKNQTN